MTGLVIRRQNHSPCRTHPTRVRSRAELHGRSLTMSDNAPRDAAGRRLTPQQTPEFHKGRPPKNKGHR